MAGRMDIEKNGDLPVSQANLGERIRLKWNTGTRTEHERNTRGTRPEHGRNTAGTRPEHRRRRNKQDMTNKIYKPRKPMNDIN